MRIKRHPGLRVAGQDRGRDRRRTAVARQQRRVQVERAVRRQVEQRRGHDLAVVGEDEQIRVVARDGADGAGSRSRVRASSGTPCSAARVATGVGRGSPRARRSRRRA